ncbi:hypothetical protein [Vibrio parahaemolyticus]|uniref:hypothetical protein n=1 Tax=Vibrio parahaemolyticus TaxID=670 RepID=UPI001EEB6C3C|nr:hypothetical protein [Vibrio parahaemolyticus]MCG6449728.1 hypothetical protein [Vibrio parahaemolyticus]
MPKFDNSPCSSISFDFLKQYDAFHLAGIFHCLSHKKKLDIDVLGNEKITRQKLELEIIEYFKQAPEIVPMLLNDPESKVKQASFNSLSLTEVKFILSSDEKLIIYLFTKIINYNERLKSSDNHLHAATSIPLMRSYIANSFIYSSIGIDDKRSKIESMLSEYYNSIGNYSFKILEDMNTLQSEWAIEYFLKLDRVRSAITYMPAIIHNKELVKTSIPAIFYALLINNAEKELLLLNFKKAWAQKKYRDKSIKEKKKTLNLVVDQYAVNNLKQLSVEFDLPVNQLVALMAERWVANVNEIKEKIKKEKNEKIDLFDKLM